MFRIPSMWFKDQEYQTYPLQPVFQVSIALVTLVTLFVRGRSSRGFHWHGVWTRWSTERVKSLVMSISHSGSSALSREVDLMCDCTHLLAGNRSSSIERGKLSAHETFFVWWTTRWQKVLRHCSLYLPGTMFGTCLWFVLLCHLAYTQVSTNLPHNPLLSLQNLIILLVWVLLPHFTLLWLLVTVWESLLGLWPLVPYQIPESVCHSSFKQCLILQGCKWALYLATIVGIAGSSLYAIATEGSYHK